MIHPLIANKCSCVLTVLLLFCNFGSTQRGCGTSKLGLEGAESEANNPTRHTNDDSYQTTATKIYLIQNISLISICDINGKQFFDVAVNVNHGDIRYFDRRRGKSMSINENIQRLLISP